MSSSGMLRCAALVRIDVSEERSASIIRVTRNGKLETMLAVTSNQRAVMEALHSSEMSVLIRDPFISEVVTGSFLSGLIWYDLFRNSIKHILSVSSHFSVLYQFCEV
jgi:hypothetical protein